MRSIDWRDSVIQLSKDLQQKRSVTHTIRLIVSPDKRGQFFKKSMGLKPLLAQSYTYSQWQEVRSMVMLINTFRIRAQHKHSIIELVPWWLKPVFDLVRIWSFACLAWGIISDTFLRRLDPPVAYLTVNSAWRLQPLCDEIYCRARINNARHLPIMHNITFTSNWMITKFPAHTTRKHRRNARQCRSQIHWGKKKKKKLFKKKNPVSIEVHLLIRQNRNIKTLQQ